MTASSDETDLVRLVHARADVLSALQDGPAEKRELVDILSVSRSTVDRALRDLRVRSLVDRRDGRYVLTLAGRLALEEFQRIGASLADAHRARAVLVQLPPDAPIDPVFLQGAEVHVAEPPAPRQPLERLSELVDAADRYRGFTNALLDPRYIEDMRDRVLAEQIEVEFIYTREIASYLADAHSEAVRETLAGGLHTMHVLDELPFGMGILYGAETHAYVVAADDDATFRGLVLNDEPAAVDWAEELYASYLDRASVFEPSL